MTRRFKPTDRSQQLVQEILKEVEKSARSSGVKRNVREYIKDDQNASRESRRRATG